MNRRRFMIGTGTVLAASAAAVAVDFATRPADRERVLHDLGLSSGTGPVEVSGVLNSRYTRAPMGWTISQPAKGRPRAIVFCLHGKGGSNRTAFDDVGVPRAAEEIGFPIVVAAVDGGADSYWHRRADGTDAMAMLLHEFVPMVRERVGSLPQALMGWSMGGYGALLAAERAGKEFCAVAPSSPALWLTPGATAPGAFDSPADFYANDVFRGVGKLRSKAIAVCCGTSDPFYSATRYLVGRMHFAHHARYGPGGHDSFYWQSVAPYQLGVIGSAPEIGWR